MADILLVEDVERVSRFIARGLNAEGHNVTVAASGEQGLRHAVMGAFDLMILDLMLPDRSGKDVCRELRNEGQQIPVLMLTAIDTVADKVDCLRGGADDYLTKPFDFDELAARVEALVRRSGNLTEPEPSIIEAAGLKIDLAARTVTRDKSIVDLTAREFQLLCLLVQSQGKVLSRTRILNKIWGYDADPMTNVVDVYVTRLRSKLNWSSTSPLCTVRGFGYRFGA